MENPTVDKMKSLIKELELYRKSYYDENKSLISDELYDKKIEELKELEKDSIILPNSPTQEVGYIVLSKLNKVTHKSPLLSLDKTKSIKEVVEFIDNKEVLIMAKADGLTTCLEYNHGKLIQGATRGNGEIGEDITHNCRTYKNLPLEISFKGYLRIVGESIILNEDFKNINFELELNGEEKYKTQRNLASGSVRQLNNEICDDRQIRFYAFGLLEAEGINFESKYSQLKFLSDLNFEIVPYYNFIPSSSQDYTEFIKLNIEAIRMRCLNNGFPIDGIVISFDDIEYSRSLGRTSHHFNDGIAYKFEDETAMTNLRSIDWSVGRTGTITPVAVFDTVELDGTEVSRASLHNLTILKNLKLGIDDEIVVQKSNMIIPQILKNNTQSDNLDIPSECPICHTETIQSTLNKSTILLCPNEFCSSRMLARFSHFVSRNAMNIEGLSESTIEKFINMGFIEKFIDIYELKNYKDEIINMDGFGEKSYEKLILSIERSKNVKLNNYLYAMGIPNVGKTTSKTLSEYFDYDKDKFFNAMRNRFDFSQLQDVGDISNQSLYWWYDNGFENRLREGLGLILNFEKMQKKSQLNTNGIFCGKKIYGTGTFANYKKEELKELIESLGGEFTNGYAKSLDYLIIGGVKGSSKEDKAKSDGVKILTEEEFIKLL